MNINAEISKIIDRLIGSGANSHEVLYKLIALVVSTAHTLSIGDKQETLEEILELIRSQWATLEEKFGDKKN